MRPPRPPREEDFTSRLRHVSVTARVGTWLGVCFAVAFLTGVWSHLYQDQPAWLPLPVRPVWLYRVTQGVHYLAGTAAVPLLLVKLWGVYPKLFARVPTGGRRLAGHLLERLSILVLVAAGVFQLATGVANSARWYPWSFSFRSTHFAVAWVAIGALLVHLAVKWPRIRDGYRQRADAEAPAGSLSRRGLLRTTGVATGLTVLAVAGGTVPWLRRVSPLALPEGPRPQGVPVNRTARHAGVVAAATDPSYALVVVHGAREVRLDLAALRALPQTTARLPIACVEGWSASGEWTGVRLRDLLDLVGAAAGTTVRVRSLQPDGPFRSSEVRGNLADDPLTLVALGLDGMPLALDHGYPCRLIAPGRPGVLQTKWLSRIEVV